MNMKTWQDYLGSSHNQSKKDLNAYASNLQENDFPVIFDWYHLCYVLNRNPEMLGRIVYSTKKFYRTFAIPKKRGGKRDISTPYPSLAVIQTWIKENILDKIETHNNCYSYVKGRSILDNANVHVSNKCHYKLDLENFFSNIKINRIISIFTYCGYSYKVSYYLARICTLDESLPQGAITSPQLSNIVCKRLDARISRFAKNKLLSYTRYADDITLSGASLKDSSRRFIKHIIRSEGFIINKKKEILLTDNNKKIITGISIGSGKATVQRNYKRELKSDVYKYLKYNVGLDINDKNYDPLYKEKLIGRLLFWRFVEKNNKYIDPLIKEIEQKEKEYILSVDQNS